MRDCFIGALILFIVIAAIRLKNSSARQRPLTPAEEAYRMMYELCDISGYGIHSGIHLGPKSDEAAAYILEKLHRAGLKDAHLETVQVNLL